MITGEQIRAARKLLGWSYMTLSRRSGQSLLAVLSAENLENKYRASAIAITIIRSALEQAGVEFADDQIHHGVMFAAPSEFNHSDANGNSYERRRFPRKHVLMRSAIVSPGVVCDRVVLNISDGGAKVSIPLDFPHYPEVILQVPEVGIAIKASMIWRDGTELGLKF